MTELLACSVTGRLDVVPNTFEGIKHGLDGATLDFVIVSPTAGFFIDDNGMLNGQPLNIPASMYAGRALWGPIVLANANVDKEGETLPPEKLDVQALTALAGLWASAVATGLDMGQDLRAIAPANAATIPPPTIVAWDPPAGGMPK